MLILELEKNYGEIKFYSLGKGILDGVGLEDFYLGWGLIETPEEKFFVKYHLSDGNEFVIGFEQYGWEKWKTRFNLETLDNHVFSGVSMKHIISQSEYTKYYMGDYKYTDGVTTIDIVILGKNLPNKKERDKIAKDWEAILGIKKE
ncbi:MAG: hypothetical protein CR959_01715 [Fusobacteriales bacterium]|nr:MAG: hypothetical protein CR959_01715 [Fusobacteriales bacterium]